MPKKFKVLIFFGTRPEAIKIAPLVAKLKSEKRFSISVAVSAQHRDMLDQVLKEFGVRSQYDLNLMKANQTLVDITAGVLQKFDAVLNKAKPDLVLVHGDTTTTLGGALTAFYRRIPIGHVEAGLRTNDLSRPFPEEMNRRLTDSICTLYFPPTAESKRHLLRENRNPKNIFVTGNTVIDALLATAKKKRPFKNPAGRFPFILMTAHRRENFGQPFKDAFSAVRELSQRFPRVHWVYPVHPNPNVKGPARKIFKGCSNVHLIKPVGYSQLVGLMEQCVLVVTDSGGLQEEAPSLGKPVLVLRDVTERPEAVRAGTVKLVGTNKVKIIKRVTELLLSKKIYGQMANAVNPYGDGKACDRILQALRWHFGISSKRPKDFKSGR